MDCLINQPVGLGDILWVQPIVDTYIKKGYDVWYPVKPIYLELLRKYFVKPNLYWVSEEDSYPLKDKYNQIDSWHSDDLLQVYLPLTHADRHIPHASIMMSKYYYAKHPLANWHESIFPYVKRDYDKEVSLMKKYNLIEDNFILINNNFGTYPSYSKRTINEESNSSILTHSMNIEQDIENGFTLFDWILAIKQAKIIHTVETSICYLIDIYRDRDGINMYEKRKNNDPLNYYRNINMVYRNKFWIYNE